MGLAMIDPEQLGNELCPDCGECELKGIFVSRDGYDYECVGVVCSNCEYEVKE